MRGPFDDGAAEVIRWCGGVGFLMDMGVLDVHDVCAPNLDKATKHSKSGGRAVMLLTSFIWDYEEALVVRLADFTSATICSAVPESAHAYYDRAGTDEASCLTERDQSMDFESYAQSLLKHVTQVQQQVGRARHIHLEFKIFMFWLITLWKAGMVSQMHKVNIFLP